MSIFIMLVVSCIVYVSTFNTDFTKEHVDKALVFLAIIAIIILLFSILISVLTG